MATISKWYCWPEFPVEVGETIDFNAMAAIFSFTNNINFDMRLIKDGTTVAETGIYDPDVIESGVLFYKGRVIGSNSSFKLCI